MLTLLFILTLVLGVKSSRGFWNEMENIEETQGRVQRGLHFHTDLNLFSVDSYELAPQIK